MKLSAEEPEYIELGDSEDEYGNILTYEGHKDHVLLDLKPCHEWFSYHFSLRKEHIPDVEKLLEHLKGLEDDGE